MSASEQVVVRSDEELGRIAFEQEQRIKQAWVETGAATWRLAHALYEFNELQGWALLGTYDSLQEWLAQPELGIKRTTFFALVRLWRDLVVVREIDAERLARLAPWKVQEVHPAIMRGVDVDAALADVEALAQRDLRVRYGNATKEQPPPQEPGGERRLATIDVVGPDDAQLDDAIVRIGRIATRLGLTLRVEIHDAARMR